MGISMHAVGFKPADKKWETFKKIWEMCEAENIHVPHEVEEFFGCEKPGDKPGMEVELGASCLDYVNEHGKGYMIDITLVPHDVRYIRVYNCY